MPGYSGVLVVPRVRSTTTKCTRGRGCIGHPAFPTPSLGGRFFNASGAWRGEVANVCLAVRVFSRHCERSEAIHSSFARQDGLLRFARNDGRVSTDYFAESVIGPRFARTRWRAPE